VSVGHPLFQSETRLTEVPAHLRAQRRELRLCGLHLMYHRGAKLGDSLGEDPAIRAKERTEIIDQGCPGLDELRADPMPGLAV
jgi:hypothetical protein